MTSKRMARAIVWGGCLMGLQGFGAVIPVTDPHVVNGLSPYNWVCREDSLSSSIMGSSLAVAFKGTRNVALRVDTAALAGLAPTRYPIVAWSVNGGAEQAQQLTPGQTVLPLAAGIKNPTIDFYIKGMSPFEDRWNGDVPVNSVKLTGLEVDEGGATKAVKLPGKVWLNIGDSIMSGDGALYAEGQGGIPHNAWAAANDGRASYGYLLAKHFGRREARLAFGGYNWGGRGLAAVPDLATLIDRKTSTTSSLVGEKLRPTPEIVLINLGENGVPAEPEVLAALRTLRRRVEPSTKIVVMIPVSGRGRAQLTQTVARYKAEDGDAQAYLVDLGDVAFATAEGQHPTAAGHETLFRAALPRFEALLAGHPSSSSADPSGFGTPFWESRTMENEPILFVREKGRERATGKLLFPARPPLRLLHPDLKTAYVEGQDYLWKPGSDTIELTAESKIPFKTAEELIPPPGSPNTLQGVLFSEGRFFHDLQVQVTYRHAGTWSWKPPPPPSTLARSLGKLKAKQPLKIVALGDSITEGYNASGFSKVNAPPYQPCFAEGVARTLQQRFGTPVTLANLGLGGTRADWGLGQVGRVTAEKPDLVILAFGMNHFEPAPAFGETMGKLLAAVRAGSPEADVVLVACMTGNPRLFPAERFTGYRDALRQLEGPQVAVADVTTPWLELLQRKPFADLSGNHVNHPNDFGHRLYAQVICALYGRE